jgi:hypothetical protein
LGRQKTKLVISIPYQKKGAEGTDAQRSSFIHKGAIFSNGFIEQSTA